MHDLRPLAIQWLNAADCLLSIIACLVIGVEEFNPIMKAVMDESVAMFIVIKLGAVHFSVKFLDRSLRGKQRKILSWILAGMSSVLLWHVWGLSNI